MTSSTCSIDEEFDSPQPNSAEITPETIINPVTGDRMTIFQSSLQNQGGYAKILFELPPGAKGSPLH